MRNYNNPLALGSAVQYLLVANLVVFILQIWLQMQQGFFGGLSVGVGWFERAFGLIPACLTYTGQDYTFVDQLGRLRLASQFCQTPLTLWQPVTYMFLHGGLMHIAFNMLALWMFGSLLERIWGMKRFLYYYFFCGVGAGLLVAAIAYASRLFFGGAAFELFPVTIGASGAVLGLLTAYGVLFPNNLIYMYFLPVKAKYAVWIFGGLSLMFAFSNTLSGISHWGHLGGILFGYIAMNWRRLASRL